MKIIQLQKALKGLKQINPEIRYKLCIDERTFSSGLIAFRPTKNSDSRQINHHDKDVICQVLKGSGRLRIKKRKVPLRPGTICHIPRGTPHDFASGRKQELVLFYSLIKTF